MQCITNNSIKYQSFVYIVELSNSSFSNNSIYYKPFVCIQFKYQTVLWDPDIKPYQVLPLRARVDLGPIENEWILCISQSSSLTTASSDCLVSGHWLGVGVYPSVEMQSVYFTAQAYWATRWRSLTPLQRCNLSI